MSLGNSVSLILVKVWISSMFLKIILYIGLIILLKLFKMFSGGISIYISFIELLLTATWTAPFAKLSLISQNEGYFINSYIIY